VEQDAPRAREVRDSFPVVVHVLLWRGARLFLLRRAATGFMDGFHALPGGHQHAGESVSEAALRECAEETGVRPARVEPVCVLPYRAGRHQGLNFVFEARDWAGEPEVAEPDLFDAGAWYPADALPEPHAAWLPEVLRLRGAGLWYREFHWD
jgi:ADP-ribose pyrophosphatase YjhB (NUDIX family)